MAETIQFHSKQKGPLGEKEDWWYLELLDGMRPAVRHEWSYHDPYNGHSNAGEQSYSTTDFLAGEHDANAKAKLKGLLAEKGLD